MLTTKKRRRPKSAAQRAAAEAEAQPSKVRAKPVLATIPAQPAATAKPPAHHDQNPAPYALRFPQTLYTEVTTEELRERIAVCRRAGFGIATRSLERALLARAEAAAKGTQKEANRCLSR